MKRARVEDPAKGLVTDEQILETTAYVVNGLRHVRPYWHTFTLHPKGRMVGASLLRAMLAEFPMYSADYYRAALDDGRLTLQGHERVSADHQLRPADLILHRVHRHEPPVTAEEPVVVARKGDYVAVNKPASVPLHPTGRFRHQSLQFMLAAPPHSMPRLLPAHRLDRLTSGLVVLSVSTEAASRFSALVRDNAVAKEYVALVHGLFPATEEPLVVDKPLRAFDDHSGLCTVDEEAGKPAVSAFQLLWSDVQRNVSAVHCFPRTGRTHQLRVHLLHLGHPIVSDPLYRAGGEPVGERVVDSDGHTALEYAAAEVGKCPECDASLYADPTPEQLRLHLHALRYSCAEFDFCTPLPPWAERHGEQHC